MVHGKEEMERERENEEGEEKSSLFFHCQENKALKKTFL